MLFRKRLSGLDAKIKKIAVGVLLVAIVAGSVFAGTSLRAGAYSKTQDVLNELLGAAKPYGVVAEEFNNLVLGTDYDYEPRENKYYIKDAD